MKHTTSVPRLDSGHYKPCCDSCGWLPGLYDGPVEATKIANRHAERLSTNLSFNQLRAANLERNRLSFESNDTWSLTDWATAVAGELGEACNLIKKIRRGETVSIEALADELADTQCYLDHLAARAGIDLGDATRSKFNRVSERIGSDVRL